MTNDEAILIMKCAIDEVEWEYPLKYAAAFDKAIEALEIQIPMKPTGEYPFYCPVCEAKLIPDPHCGMCGQAIDWKEVSDETETSDT